jgi:hypothetical protein
MLNLSTSNAQGSRGTIVAVQVGRSSENLCSRQWSRSGKKKLVEREREEGVK